MNISLLVTAMAGTKLFRMQLTKTTYKHLLLNVRYPRYQFGFCTLEHHKLFTDFNR